MDDEHDRRGWRRDRQLSRRRLLRLAALAAGTGALAVPAGAIGGFGAAARARPDRPRPVPPPGEPAAFVPALPSAPPALPSWIAEGPALPAAEPFPHPRLVPRAPVAGVRPAATRPAASHPASSLRPPGAARPRDPGHAGHPGTPAGEPAWVHTWDAPVRRLDDFLARSPHSSYPRNAILLTIDDGPCPQWTPKYLRLLARYHVPATFTVIGSEVHEYPHLVRAAVSEGHHIANHTFRHPLNLPQLPHKRIRAELEDTTDAIVRASGFRPRQFRAPGGVWGADVFAEVSRQQMLPLGWNIDPRDWALPGVAEIRSAMLAARPHDIILCHDGGGDRSQTYAALKTVIPALLARGWRFVTLPAPKTI